MVRQILPALVLSATAATFFAKASAAPPPDVSGSIRSGRSHELARA